MQNLNNIRKIVGDRNLAIVSLVGAFLACTAIYFLYKRYRKKSYFEENTERMDSALSQKPFECRLGVHPGNTRYYITDTNIDVFKEEIASPNITMLSLLNCDITKERLKELCIALGESSVTDLDFRGTKLCKEGMQYIHDLLAQGKITSLNISDTALDDNGVTILCNIINDPSVKLTRLFLNALSLSHTADSWKSITGAIGNNKTLRILNIDAGGFMGPRKIASLDEALQKTNILCLAIEGSAMDQEACDSLNTLVERNKQLLSVHFLDVKMVKAHAYMFYQPFLRAMLKNDLMASFTINLSDVKDSAKCITEVYFDDKFPCHNTSLTVINEGLNPRDTDEYPKTLKLRRERVDELVNEIVSESQKPVGQGNPFKTPQNLCDAYKYRGAIKLKLFRTNNPLYEHFIPYVEKHFSVSFWMKRSLMGI